jgi:hypothetical protein
VALLGLSDHAPLLFDLYLEPKGIELAARTDESEPVLSGER